MTAVSPSLPSTAMAARALAIAQAGGIEQAIVRGALEENFHCTVSEALVLGLMRQEVRKFFAVFGHGSTDLAEALRVYADAGVVRVYAFRNEVSMAHAATALRWQYGEQVAVITSIGPGALQAMAASLAAASNGVGLWHVYGDESTHDEGFNMQQIPKYQQGLFGQLTAIMGESYTLHTPEALRTALQRGSVRVNHPARPGPFYLMLPINIQPAAIRGLRVTSLPKRLRFTPAAATDVNLYAEAAALVARYRKIVIKAGGGARPFALEVRALADEVGGVVVLSPGSLGVLRDDDVRNMLVGGSKGSICGNAAMEGAELLISVGSRAVCQADCSGVGYPNARAVININADLGDAAHYNRTLMLNGDIGLVIPRLIEATRKVQFSTASEWLEACTQKKAEWRARVSLSTESPPLQDRVWGCPVLTQPAALKITMGIARKSDATCLFDAGDVQANGFQLACDDWPMQTITESGSSYMGFAVSALTASGIADRPKRVVAFTGDGSFVMNPQVLIEAVEHRARATIVLFDNRRMAAISSLQLSQYGCDFATNDAVAVDYVALANSVRGVLGLWGGTSRESLASAMEMAITHPGLSFVHVPVYFGPDERGGLGAYGHWNVGNWVHEVQAIRLAQDL